MDQHCFLEPEEDFALYIEKLVLVISKNELKKFNGKKHRFDMMKFMDKLEEKYTVDDEDSHDSEENSNKIKRLSIKPKTNRGKDMETALTLKEEGNEAFNQGDYVTALKKYNNSYLCTPSDDASQIVMILSNRTAALFRLAKYEECLNEINNIFRTLPDNDVLLYKLMDRRARCHLALNEEKRALVAFRLTLGFLEKNTELPLEEKRIMEASTNKMIKSLQKSMKKAVKVVRPALDNKMDVIDDIKKRSKTHPSASDAVTIINNDKEGRHAIAARAIDLGELILKEKSHAHCLFTQYFTKRCLNCCKSTLTPLACPDCSDVIFCSKSCFNIAIYGSDEESSQAKRTRGYHAIECQFQEPLILSGCGPAALLALRMISQKPLDYFINLKEDIEKIDKGVDLNYNVKDSADYLSIYRLMTHSSQHVSYHLFSIACIGLHLARCLDVSGYFDICKDLKDRKELIYYCGSLIMHNLQVCKYNLHDVNELVVGDPNPEDVNFAELSYKSRIARIPILRSIGCCIYPTLSLFNHSCIQKVVRYQRGTQVFIRTLTPFSAGEEIPDNYGPMFTEDDLLHRTLMLNNFKFECRCEACIENWILPEPFTHDLKFRCQSASNCNNAIPVNIEQQIIREKRRMFLCNKCRKDTDVISIVIGMKLLEFTKNYKDAHRLLIEENVKESLWKYLRLLKRLLFALLPPNAEIHACQMKTQLCFALLLGNIGDEYYE